MRARSRRGVRVVADAAPGPLGIRHRNPSELRAVGPSIYLDLRFAANCRFDADVEAALDEVGWPVAEYDRGVEPDEGKLQEGSTMQWGAR
jgi:hypothetical protein